MELLFINIILNNNNSYSQGNSSNKHDENNKSAKNFVNDTVHNKNEIINNNINNQRNIELINIKNNDIDNSVKNSDYYKLILNMPH